MPLSSPAADNLLASQTLSANASSVTLEDFSVDPNTPLLIRADIIGLAGAINTIKPNGAVLTNDRTVTNINANAAALNPASTNRLHMGELATATSFCTVNVTFYNDLFLITGLTQRVTAAYVARYESFGGVGDFTDSALTSLEFFADDGAGGAVVAYGSGSVFSLYKVA